MLGAYEIHVQAGALLKRLESIPSDGAFVYFIYDGDAVKIGSAYDPHVRLAELQISNPRPLRLVSGFQGGRQAERFLHQWFAEHRIHGEWFHADAPGLEALAAHYAERPLETRASECCEVLVIRGRCCRCGDRA